MAGEKLHYLAADRFRRDMVQRGAAAIDDYDAWASIEGGGYNQHNFFDQFRAKADTFALSAGGSLGLTTDLRLLGAIGYRRIGAFAVLDGPPIQGDGEGVQAGLGLAWQPGNFQLTGSVSGGFQKLDTQRYTNIFTPLTAFARLKSEYLQLALSGGYTYRFTGGFLRPSLDVAGTALRQLKSREVGLGGLGWQRDSHTQWLWSVSPQMTAGITLAQHHQSRAELQLRAGGVFQLQRAIIMPYRFIGANPAADPALLTLPLSRQAALLGADLVFTQSDRISVSGGITSVAGKRDKSVTGSLKVLFKF